jgi:L-threonylcarbamoyladenylate synthase
METQVLTIDPQNIDMQKIEQAAQILRSGGLVAFPTETVYGLGADAFNADAVSQIFTVKERPTNDPIIVHVAEQAQLTTVAMDIPPIVNTLIEKFWPGPLTIVLKRAAQVAQNVGGGHATVGVRMPAHPVALALITSLGKPIAAPSANRFGHTSPTDAHHVLDDLNAKIPLILDAGATEIGVESTVIDLSVDPPQLLRPGGVPLEALEPILPNIVVTTRYASPDPTETLEGPGLLEKHYAPKAELRLIEGPDAAIRRHLVTLSNELLDAGKSVGLLVANEDKETLLGLDVSVEVVTLGPLHDLSKIAQHLYHGMRKLDVRKVDVILARSYPQQGIGAALRDRLVRAAQGKVITVHD